MSLLLLGLAIAIFILGKEVSWLAVYQTDLIVRFIAVYIIIFFFSFTMEKVRYNIQGQMETANKEIQRALAKVQEGTAALAESNRELLMEITERKRAEKALKGLSFKDELTGLYNRRGFFILAEQALKTVQRLGSEMMLIFGDLDNLKGINDTLGHKEGDQALVDTSQILKETFRESDIIARIGGDEFLILAIDATDETREVLMERLHSYLDEYNRPEGRSYTLSLSTGIAFYDPKKPLSLDELIAQADTLMYKEKRNKQH